MTPSPPFDSHQQSKPKQINTIKLPSQERITIVDDIIFSRENMSQPACNKKSPCIWAGCIKNSQTFVWMRKQCISAENRYAFQMSVGFTLAALLVIIEPVSHIFPNPFWVGKVQCKR